MRRRNNLVRKETRRRTLKDKKRNREDARKIKKERRKDQEKNQDRLKERDRRKSVIVIDETVQDKGKIDDKKTTVVVDSTNERTNIRDGEEKGMSIYLFYLVVTDSTVLRKVIRARCLMILRKWTSLTK